MSLQIWFCVNAIGNDSQFHIHTNLKVTACMRILFLFFLFDTLLAIYMVSIDIFQIGQTKKHTHEKIIIF